MEDLVATRDALGIVREIRRYKREQEEANENFREQQRQRDEDYADRLAEIDEQYAIERDRRLRDFELRMADMREDFHNRLAELRRQKAEELRELKAQLEERRLTLEEERKTELKSLEEGYDELVKNLTKNFIERIRGIDASLLSDYKTYQQHLLDISSTFQSVLNGYIKLVGEKITTGTTRGKQLGGYATRGLYELGEAGEEFVLNNRMTRTLEKLAGGRLSQSKILGMLAGQQVRASAQIEMNIKGALSESERRMLRRDVQGEVINAFQYVFGVG
jgi:hypothetical protein